MVTSRFNKSLTDLLKFLLCHSCDPTYHFKRCLQVCILFLFQLSTAVYQPTLQFNDLKEQFNLSFLTNIWEFGCVFDVAVYLLFFMWGFRMTLKLCFYYFFLLPQILEVVKFLKYFEGTADRICWWLGSKWCERKKGIKHDWIPGRAKLTNYKIRRIVSVMAYGENQEFGF